MALLHAVAGALRGATFQLVAEEVTIGRQESNQLCVGDPSVSRQHCVIQPQEDGFQIRDLGSINGTFVNGKRVDERILEDGDKIRIGDTVFHFAVKEDELADQHLALPDNALVAKSCVGRPPADSVDTAISRLFESVPQGDFITLATFRLKNSKGASNCASGPQEKPPRLAAFARNVRRGREGDSEVCFGWGRGKEVDLKERGVSACESEPHRESACSAR